MSKFLIYAFADSTKVSGEKMDERIKRIIIGIILPVPIYLLLFSILFGEGINNSLNPVIALAYIFFLICQSIMLYYTEALKERRPIVAPILENFIIYHLAKLISLIVWGFTSPIELFGGDSFAIAIYLLGYNITYAGYAMFTKKWKQFGGILLTIFLWFVIGICLLFMIFRNFRWPG
jgi:hypothetical protein